MHKLFTQSLFCGPAYAPHAAHPAAAGRCTWSKQESKPCSMSFSREVAQERKAKAQGLTVAADLCSFVSGAGGASCAVEGEGGAAALVGKDRAVLPVSWDPMRSSRAPRSALDVQPCKTGGWGEHEKVLKGETSSLGRKGGRCWRLRPSSVKGLGQGGGSKQLWSTVWCQVCSLTPLSPLCNGFHLLLPCSQGALTHLLASTGLSMPVATQEKQEDS